MDVLFGLDDFFGAGGIFANPLVVILPVLIVIVGVVVVFLFGSKSHENPKAKKTSEQSNNNKTKKRSTPDVTLAQMPASKTSAVLQKSLRKEDAKHAVTLAKINNIGASVASTTKAATKTNNKKILAALPLKKSGNVKEKKASKNAEKPLDNSPNDGGEWQTVITKKQKKASTEFIIQPVAEIDVPFKTKTTKKTIVQNINPNKQAKEQANKTKKATIAQQKQQETDNKAPEVMQVDNKLFLEEIKAAVPATVVASKTAATPLQSAVISSLSMSTVKALEAVEAIAVPEASVTNVAFDELGDAAWTEATTPKKSKKRALRE